MNSIVWFKRDLRVADHQPLAIASSKGSIIPLYVIEEEYWQQPFTSLFHWKFIQQALECLNHDLEKLGSHLSIYNGKILDVLSSIHTKVKFSAIYCHQETGGMWTFNRDKQVIDWCRNNNVKLFEFSEDGIVRGMQDRTKWTVRRNQQIFKPVVITNKLSPNPLPKQQYFEPKIFRDDLSINHIQSSGSNEAKQILNSFITSRGSNYQKGMSSPISASNVCSRLSPHLAYGTISVREVLNTINNTHPNQPLIARYQINAFRKRLFWRMHFIQKLETMPEIEYQNMHPFYHGIRESCDINLLKAWQTGMTGYPFIDACMRYLHKYGWINFRMRAMLVSFASYNLWLDWRVTSNYLATLFTDFEPGIHYCQFQMQSGTTGINLPRVYNPIKQSMEQDPEGKFIRRYVPELSKVTDDYIHTPWELSPTEQKSISLIIGVDYPKPIVEHLSTSKLAKDRIWKVRKLPGFRVESNTILRKLTIVINENVDS